MKWNSFIASATVALVCSVPLFAADVDGISAKFTVAESTMVPGLTLQPGTYSIKVMDHLADRFVLRIEGAGGVPHTIFIAVPSNTVKASASSGAVTWNSGANGKQAVRGFVFGRGIPSMEFVYPKNEAVSIATSDRSSVLAIDPESEGKSPMLEKLTQDEMHMVTLWTLDPQRVGSDENAAPKITATKYQSAEAMAIAASDPVPTPAPAAGATPNQYMASVKKPTRPLESLPHTASNLPALFLAGLLALTGAVYLRVRSGATAQ